jgi:hypothetical protein
MAILVGCAITAGTTYALVNRVQHLIAAASVDPNPNTWIQAAQTQAYDACYLGCSDCGNPSYAYDACAKTAQANVTGIICDGNRMWNWKDRYPPECLAAVGEILKADALAAQQQTYRNQLAIIILTVLGGVVGGWITYKLWKRCTERRPRIAEVTREGASKSRFFRVSPWRTKGAKEKAPRAGKGRVKMLWAISLGLFARKASAYACTGYNPAYNQYFVNSDGTIFGLVHGWLSDCYDQRVCSTSCSTTCSKGSSGGSSSCSQSCTTSCITVTYSDKAPQAFVNDIMPKVKACGFQPADAVGGVVDTRIANWGIERNWWVKISVNGYNITKSTDTDVMILCLHDIGGT